VLLNEASASALTWIWALTVAWITIRMLFGLVRVWPGVGEAPLGRARQGVRA